MRWMSPLALLLALGVLSAVFTLRQRPIPADVAYTGSETCVACHRDAGESWQSSLHTKMMRPVHDPGVLAADFADADLPFDPANAVWAIGGKWEQQFMGRVGGHETLLPGAWEVEHEVWRRVGWDGWQVPEPLRRCHGCHTVGLNVETGEYVEPNVGCESCHGPGEWHAKTFGLGRIHSSADPQVCGQCHSRGRSPDGSLFFPAGYVPGDDLNGSFVLEEPAWGQNSSSWWGNGRERRRHQQYAAWARGGHAASLDSLRVGYDGRYGPATDACLSCHAAEAVLEPRHAPSLEDARWGITCQVCHNSHGELDQARSDCRDCHTKGAFEHEPARNNDHVPCPETAQVDCVDCHMPLVIENGGRFAMRTHAPGPVHPRESGEFGVPSSCASGTCHATEGWEELADAFDRHYGDPALAEKLASAASQ